MPSNTNTEFKEYKPQTIKKDVSFEIQPGYANLPNNTDIQNRNGPRIYIRDVSPITAPAVIPPYIGDIYIDKTAQKVYIATNVLAPTDRQILN